MSWSDGDFVTPTNLNNMGGERYNVMSYGAAGDGSTDDTSAINNAISDASANANGGVVFLPGLHVVSSTLTVQSDDVTLQGGGAKSAGTSTSFGKIISKISAGNAPIIRIDGFRSGIRNLTIKSSFSGVDGVIIGDGSTAYDSNFLEDFHITGTSGLTTESVGVQQRGLNGFFNTVGISTFGTGIRFTGAGATDNRHNNCNNLLIESCYSHNIRLDTTAKENMFNGLVMKGSGGSATAIYCEGIDNTFVGVTCISAGSHGIHVTGDGSRNVFSGVNVAGAKGHGIYLEGTVNVVSGARVSNSTGHGIFADGNIQSISGVLCFDNDQDDTDTYDNINIKANLVAVSGAICRTTTGGTTRARHGIRVESGSQQPVLSGIISESHTGSDYSFAAGIKPHTGGIYNADLPTNAPFSLNTGTNFNDMEVNQARLVLAASGMSLAVSSGDSLYDIGSNTSAAQPTS